MPILLSDAERAQIAKDMGYQDPLDADQCQRLLDHIAIQDARVAELEDLLGRLYLNFNRRGVTLKDCELVDEIETTLFPKR